MCLCPIEPKPDTTTEYEALFDNRNLTTRPEAAAAKLYAQCPATLVTARITSSTSLSVIPWNIGRLIS